MEGDDVEVHFWDSERKVVAKAGNQTVSTGVLVRGFHKDRALHVTVTPKNSECK